jgi:flagellin
VLQVGTAAADTKSVTVGVVDTTTLAINTLDLTSHATAQTAIGLLDTAIGTVASQRGSLGAVIKDTLQANANSLSVALENVTATESFIRDTNMASETSEYTKNQILVQAGVSVLAQANVASQSVLSLLG